MFLLQDLYHLFNVVMLRSMWAPLVRLILKGQVNNKNQIKLFYANDICNFLLGSLRLIYIYNFYLGHAFYYFINYLILIAFDQINVGEVCVLHCNIACMYLDVSFNLRISLRGLPRESGNRTSQKHVAAYRRGRTRRVSSLRGTESVSYYEGGCRSTSIGCMNLNMCFIKNKKIT